MPPDILLVILDTARADAFRPWGGPHPSPTFEWLCERGIRYERAIAPAPWTLPSAASLLTGVMPSEHGINGRAFMLRGGRPTSPAHAVRGFEGPWVPEALRARGYATFAVSCNPWLSTWGGFDRGFDAFVDVRAWPPVRRGRVAGATRRARQMLGRRGHGGSEALAEFRRWCGLSATGPRFAMVDLMETHAPYDPPPSLHPARPSNRVLADVAWPVLLHRQFRQAGLRQAPDRAYLAAVRELYLASARRADALAGAFVRSFLASSARAAAVVMLSDHGENLGDHGLFAHHSSLHESLLHVPLAIWGRGIDLGAGSVVGGTSTRDVGPWLLDLADGSDVPPSPTGPVHSEYESTLRHVGLNRELRARAGRDGRAALPGLVEHAGLAVRDGARKYVVLDDGRETLFDLATDPAESHDVRVSADRLEPFQGARDAWLERLRRPAAETEGMPAEDEVAEHLRMLGYLE